MEKYYKANISGVDIWEMRLVLEEVFYLSLFRKMEKLCKFLKKRKLLNMTLRAKKR